MSMLRGGPRRSSSCGSSGVGRARFAAITCGPGSIGTATTFHWAGGIGAPSRVTTSPRRLGDHEAQPHEPRREPNALARGGVALGLRSSPRRRRPRRSSSTRSPSAERGVAEPEVETASPIDGSSRWLSPNFRRRRRGRPRPSPSAPVEERVGLGGGVGARAGRPEEESGDDERTRARLIASAGTGCGRPGPTVPELPTRRGGRWSRSAPPTPTRVAGPPDGRTAALDADAPAALDTGGIATADRAPLALALAGRRRARARAVDGGVRSPGVRGRGAVEPVQHIRPDPGEERTDRPIATIGAPRRGCVRDTGDRGGARPPSSRRRRAARPASPGGLAAAPPSASWRRRAWSSSWDAGRSARPRRARRGAVRRDRHREGRDVRVALRALLREAAEDGATSPGDRRRDVGAERGRRVADDLDAPSGTRCRRRGTPVRSS